MHTHQQQAENPMVVGNVDPIEAGDADRRYATEQVLADMDSFSDFLSCLGKTRVDSEWITRFVGGEIQMRLRKAFLHEVLHLLVTSDDAETVTLARDELVDRYLADRSEAIAMKAQDFAYEARG
mgnify:CR=1 FL=1